MPRGACANLACGGASPSGEIYCERCLKWVRYAGMLKGEKTAAALP